MQLVFAGYYCGTGKEWASLLSLETPEGLLKAIIMGIFTDFQPIYAEKGIPTFPVLGKKPAVANYAKIGCQGSGQLALKFPNVDALAFVAGRRAGITVVDIDSADEDLLRDTLKRYGFSAIIVRTASGGFHLWYRHNGEDRRIRSDPDVPVDFLGGGVVVGPPSKSSKGDYEFIHGNLDHLHLLRPAANLIDLPKSKLMRPVAPLVGLITEGRNQALFEHLMPAAHKYDSFEALLYEANAFANTMTDRRARHPFTDVEIRKTALSVWRITERGDNRFGGKPHTILVNEVRDQLHALGPDAMYLYSILRTWSAHEETFPITNSITDHLPCGKWGREKLRAARSALIKAGLVIQVRTATTGRVASYRWP